MVRWLAFVPLLVSCSRGAPRTPALQPSARPATSASPTAAWNLAEQLTMLHRATPRATSEHVHGEFDGEVLVNDAAKAYPALGPHRTLMPGATLVERHVARGAETTAVYFAMVKRSPGYDPDGGDWEYLVVSPDGTIEERGRIPLCGRCHAEAPHDHLFGAGR
jgi:hypothetical protein